MAVYKPTLCSPFLNGVDARVGLHTDLYDEALFKFLTCRVDTSNKDITGYKIKILDSNNNQIFPISTPGSDDYISPISELQIEEFGYVSGDTNSGVNGTTLKIPFFQNVINKQNPDYVSYNALYYSDTFLADHIIMDTNVKPFLRDLTDMENANNWQISSDRNHLTYNWPGASTEEQRRNAIVLDGDRVMMGDIILVAGSNNNKCGLWKATANTSSAGGSATIETIFERFTDVSANQRITILKGTDCHNTSWKCDNSATSTTTGTITNIVTGIKWSDSRGNDILGFGNKDNIYKWEITLYQGNHGEVQSTGSGKYVVYNDVDPEWMDMTLSSGKIMGTTAERIQIAGIFGNNYDDYINGILPEGTDVDPLVLQGKYLGFSNSATYPTTILSSGERVCVKNYDTSFGHAYPMSNSLDALAAQQATYCQFFEHSNNPDEILDTDIVNYTFKNNQSLSFWGIENGSWKDYASEAAWLAGTSITERYIVISSNSAGISGVNEGDLILLANQNQPKQNGVYTYMSVHAKVNDVLTTKYCIERAASYDSWASYIGKIIYTVSGDTISRANLQSLASAGAYTLWNPMDTFSGSSALYFVEERPIVLFRNKIGSDRTFDLFDVNNDRPNLDSPTERINFNVDGIAMQLGDLVIFKDGKYGTILNLTSSSYEVGNPAGILTENEYFYILSGKTLGKLVFKWHENTTQSWSADSATWDLHTAAIMHNTTTRTFISPWTGLKKNMKICLLDNKEVYSKKTSGTSIPYNSGSKWIKVSNFNDKLFFIEHDPLSSVYNARDDESTNLPQPLQSYNSFDTTVPWKYDIKFFFRASDENPFYSYETPYLKLYKNGEEYSDLTMVGGSADLYVKKNQSSLFATDQFLTNTGGNFVVTMYTSQASITGRSIALSAEYIQFGQSSWENYEWILYNNLGEVVQDTGKRYDKDIGVVFYGLSNDNIYSVEYWAVLLIENDYGDILQYRLKLLIAPGTQSSFMQEGKIFTATPDCSTQSVIINFNGLDSVDDSYSMYRREYEVYRKPGLEITGFYCAPSSSYSAEKKGKFFTDSSCEHEIAPKNIRYLYKDNVTGFVYQYNPKYGADYPGYPLYEFTPTQTYKIYKGEWKPVLVKDTRAAFRDFNVQNNRSYQYIVYPGDSNILEYGLETAKQTFANYDGKIWQINTEDPTQGVETYGNYDTSASNGEAISMHWKYWSIAELIPEELSIDAPIIKKKYKIDDNNIWLFKYSLDTGSQTQNFSKEEFQTLGQFPKYGFGAGNSDSGSISALLGSEIIPYSKTQYIERLSQSRVQPLSSNEKAEMLKQWRSFCFSKNPKLLKDIKGQSWIVQVLSNSNTPQNFVMNTPDTISFQWKQVESPENVIIYGNLNDVDQEIFDSYGDIEWVPMYQSNN